MDELNPPPAESSSDETELHDEQPTFTLNGHLKYPIPLWVKLFGAAVLVVFVFSLIRLPQSLSSGILLSKAEKAEARKQYLTEQHFLDKLIKEHPNMTEAHAHMIIASYYNLDIEALVKSFSVIKDKPVEDEDLFAQVSAVMNKAGSYFPSDSLSAYSSKFKGAPNGLTDADYKNYTSKFPDDATGYLAYAGYLYENDSYQKLDSVLNFVLSIEKDNLLAMRYKTAVKRVINQLDSSFYYCDKLLLINPEASYAISSKARTFLKKGDNRNGMDMAKKAFDLDDKDPYSYATMALAYHYNHDNKKRDEMVAQAKSIPALVESMKFANDVIKGVDKL